MLVYRIETEDGEGAFAGQLVYNTKQALNEDGDYDFADPSRHPSPRDCPVLRDVFRPLSEQYFGFHSMRQLLRWFDSEKFRAKMKELGGVVAIYEIQDSLVTISPEQVIFYKPGAVRVDTQPIPTVVTHETV